MALRAGPVIAFFLLNFQEISHDSASHCLGSVVRIKFTRLKDRLSAFWRSGLIGAAGAVFLGLLFLLFRSDPRYPQDYPIGDVLSDPSFDLPLKYRRPAKINEAV